VIDRNRQRSWLCADSYRVGDEIPVTTARSQPAPGVYAVFAKDPLTTSTFGPRFAYLDDFVAFATGRYSGARIGFHAVPRAGGSEYLQAFDSVGQLDWWGASAGCIRARPTDARRIWNWLAVGDPVIVLT
jgi:hypothetical protein